MYELNGRIVTMISQKSSIYRTGKRYLRLRVESVQHEVSHFLLESKKG